MEEKAYVGLLTEILALSLNEADCPVSVKERLDPHTLTAIYQYAKKHDLSHIIYGFLQKNGINAEPELLAKLKKDAMTAIYRYEGIKYCFNEICGILEENNIAFVTLKGAVLRDHYPKDLLRTSCDVDILVREADIDTAVAALKSRGYRYGERNYHDVSMYSPGNVLLELHFSITENMDSLDRVLKDAWSYAHAADGSRMEFCKEFFTFHIYAHMAYHFLTGGCGLRSLMDIWVMENRMQCSYICASELLKKAGIYRFAQKISELSKKCFSGEALDSFDEKVFCYVLDGGVYGSTENSVAVRKNVSGSNLKYALKRLFLPYKTMVVPYPVLKKAPYLLPFFWVVRWVKALFGGKFNRMTREFSFAASLDEERLSEIKEICQTLELQEVQK